MKEPHEMTSLSEMMDYLRKEGFVEDFSPDEKTVNSSSGKKYNPDELLILKVYRFEGISDPNDMSVLYTIKTNDGKKGLLVDAFGTYAEYNGQNSVELLKQIPMRDDAQM